MGAPIGRDKHGLGVHFFQHFMRIGKYLRTAAFALFSDDVGSLYRALFDNVAHAHKFNVFHLQQGLHLAGAARAKASHAHANLAAKIPNAH